VSAAEKLRALDGKATAAPWKTKRWSHRATEVVGPSNPDRPGYLLLPTPKEWAELAVVLRNVLPQIVAVVSAAERADKTRDYDALMEFRRALATLDEALS
jgi:hypothetical protein